VQSGPWGPLDLLYPHCQQSAEVHEYETRQESVSASCYCPVWHWSAAAAQQSGSSLLPSHKAGVLLWTSVVLLQGPVTVLRYCSLVFIRRHGFKCQYCHLSHRSKDPLR